MLSAAGNKIVHSTAWTLQVDFLVFLEAEIWMAAACAPVSPWTYP